MFRYSRGARRIAPATATPHPVPTPPIASRIPLPAALRSPAFRRFWAGNGFLFFARVMDVAVISWFIVQLTDSPFLVALVAVVRMAPMAFAGPTAGIIADRFNPITVMRLSRAVMIATHLAMASIIAIGSLDLWQLYFIVGFGGAAWTFDMAARRSLTPELVDRQSLSNAIALEVLMFTGMLMLGPIVAGSLLPYINTAAFFVGFAVLIAISTFALSGVADNVEPCERTRTSYLQSLADGFSVVRGNPAIAGALLVAAVSEGFAFSFIPLLPVFATDILGAGSTGLGLLLAAEGIGAITASLAVAIMSRREIAYGRLMLAGSGAAMLLGFGLAASPWYGLTFALLVGLGAAGALFFIMQTNVILTLTPREVRGRLIGLQMLVIGSFPLGALIVGSLASLISPQAAVMIMSTIGLVLLIAIASMFRVVWRGAGDGVEVSEGQAAG